MHIRDLKMKNSRESNNNKKPRKEIIMNIPNTNKSARNHAAALLGVAFLCFKRQLSGFFVKRGYYLTH